MLLLLRASQCFSCCSLSSSPLPRYSSKSIIFIKKGSKMIQLQYQNDILNEILQAISSLAGFIFPMPTAEKSDLLHIRVGSEMKKQMNALIGQGMFSTEAEIAREGIRNLLL